MIEINHLVKKYGEHVAVDDLTLTVEPGKIYGFLGPNGAGKSTTMNMITGYLGATSGEVKINGHDIFADPQEAKKCVGYLPEIPPLYTEMTVREYLDFVAELKGLDKKVRKTQTEEIMELTHTKEVSERLIRNLSKGYRQRVGFAQAIMGYPDVIILDEPTVGLDPKQIIEVRELIKELGKKAHRDFEFPYSDRDFGGLRSCVYPVEGKTCGERFDGTSAGADVGSTGNCASGKRERAAHGGTLKGTSGCGGSEQRAGRSSGGSPVSCDGGAGRRYP